MSVGREGAHPSNYCFSCCLRGPRSLPMFPYSMMVGSFLDYVLVCVPRSPQNYLSRLRQTHTHTHTHTDSEAYLAYHPALVKGKKRNRAQVRTRKSKPCVSFGAQPHSGGVIGVPQLPLSHSGFPIQDSVALKHNSCILVLGEEGLAKKVQLPNSIIMIIRAVVLPSKTYLICLNIPPL